MDIGSRMLERAEEAERKNTARKIERNRARLNEAGTADCEICEEPIPAKRREAMPSARRCIDCQTKTERRNA